LTSQGHARTIFRRALARGNLLVAEATAREVGRLSLDEALELTILISTRQPDRHPRVAARWLRRYLEANERATIDQAVLVAAALAGLRGPERDRSVGLLREMASERKGG
jgi:hypothetical protein